VNVPTKPTDKRLELSPRSVSAEAREEEEIDVRRWRDVSRIWERRGMSAGP